MQWHEVSPGGQIPRLFSNQLDLYADRVQGFVVAEVDVAHK
jgi:hypothetical protein